MNNLLGKQNADEINVESEMINVMNMCERYKSDLEESQAECERLREALVGIANGDLAEPGLYRAAAARALKPKETK